MNVVKQLHIDNSDSDVLKKLDALAAEFQDEEYENEQGYGRCYNARRRYRRMLNKLSGGLGGESHITTSNGWNSNGVKNLVIGN